jgi:hypothetical protein
MHNNGGPKELYILSLMLKCNLVYDELDKQYMVLYVWGK